MNKDIKISVTPGENGELRFGTLPDIPQRASYSFEGTIKAPFEYFKARTRLFSNEAPGIISYDNNGNILPSTLIQLQQNIWNKFAMVVEVDRENSSILFIENNLTTVASAEVKGSLCLTTEISNLGINARKVYTSKSLSDLLKMNRLLFAESEESMRIVAALRDFAAQVHTEIESANDDKGNKRQVFDQKISQKHELSFTLNWPVIVGEDKCKFKVEICYDIRDRQIEFWLESVEMHEAVMSSQITLIDQEIKKFQEAGITVIEK